MQALEQREHDPVYFGAPNSPNSYLDSQAHKERIRNSGTFTADGNYRTVIRNTPWAGNSVTFPSNPDPDLYQDTDKTTVGKYVLDYYTPLMLSHPYVDGIYVDSLWYWGRFFNFRKDHYPAADIPLTYRDTDHPIFGQAHVPGVYNVFSVQEFLWELRERLHEEGKILMGNCVRTYGSETRAFNAFATDVFGAEVRLDNLLEAEEDFAFYRSVGYRKPAVGLIYEGWDNEANVAALWKRSLLYGFFGHWAAISFEEFAAAGPLPETTEGMTEVEIEYQRRYAPALNELSEAGWNPITGVRASDSSVRVERYGSKDHFYLVLWNNGEAKTVALDVDHDVVRWPGKGQVTSVLDENQLSDRQAEALTEDYVLSLAADEVKVLHFSQLAGNEPGTIEERVEAYRAQIEAYVAQGRLDQRVAQQMYAGIDRVLGYYEAGRYDAIAWELRRQMRTLEQNRHLVPDDEVWDYLVEEGTAILEAMIAEGEEDEAVALPLQQRRVLVGRHGRRCTEVPVLLGILGLSKVHEFQSRKALRRCTLQRPALIWS